MITATQEKQTPAGYKQTEVGVIPSDWDVKELREIVHFRNGRAHENFISDYGNYIVVNSKFISSGGQVIKYSNESFVPASKNSILMVMSDVPNGRAIAKCFLVDRDNTYTVNQRICALTPTIDSQFLFYKLDRNPFYLSFDDGVKQTNLRRDDVLNCKLGVPKERTEQAAIGSVLSNADDLIESLEKLISKKRAIKQGAMQELLTGKRRLPGFNGKWEVKKIGDMANIVSGGTPSTRVTKYWIGNIKWCTPTDITAASGNYLFDTERHISEEGLKHSSATLLPPGTLLLCSRATVGDVKIAASVISTNQGFKSLVCKNEVDNEFIYYKLLMIKPKLIEKAIGSTFPEISKKEIALIEIDIPADKKEQTAIASTLSDIDAEIDALEQKHAKYQQLKQGMIQVLLTGKIRLPH